MNAQKLMSSFLSTVSKKKALLNLQLESYYLEILTTSFEQLHAKFKSRLTWSPTSWNELTNLKKMNWVSQDSKNYPLPEGAQEEVILPKCLPWEKASDHKSKGWRWELIHYPIPDEYLSHM